MRTHFVYEVFDAAGVALYVGCTAKPEQRARWHSSAALWAPYASTSRMFGPFTQNAALNREWSRTRELRPVFNRWAGQWRNRPARIRAYMQAVAS